VEAWRTLSAVIDVVLVRHGPLVGVMIAAMVAALAVGLVRALAARRRRAAFVATLGPAEALDERAIGRTRVRRRRAVTTRSSLA
jgi:ribose/xylose/arabinose/galactoside ABC-type transport system permease subunit